MDALRVQSERSVLGRYKRFALYCILGGAGVVVDLGVFFVCANLLDVPYGLANVFSITCGIITSFVLNATFTFRKRDRLLRRFFLFYGVGLFGMALSSATLYVFVGWLGFDKNLVKLATVYVVFVQYELNRRFSFGK